ncbi:Nucleotide-binding universal stress protein, UspA family [Nakamurella panacisegetis]|uniref:Nucleotide-binding universal stress protein, UspA family n=1 Tax=Nakamurella panacisegetis TaxID=1090615 RepID=A0A1H0S9Z9_9ACTN|nr:universal stress protein [Nakamurella panacisegetis]SDP38631.1 Nucleotide-binding universal stress protein, UspA family [Nakamurella panacisegetis]
MSASAHDSRPIIVGLDGSDSSLAALRWALHEAVTAQVPVEVIHCWEPQDFTDVLFASAHELSTASVCLLQTEVSAAVRGMAGPPAVTQSSVHGRAATALLQRSGNARMIVLGAREKRAVRDLLRGPVERTVRRHATCPVVVVDRHGRVVTGPEASAGTGDPAAGAEDPARSPG